MARDLLRAGPLLEAPEAKGRVVPGADELAAVGAEGEAGDGVGMSEHVVCALTWEELVSTGVLSCAEE